MVSAVLALERATCDLRAGRAQAALDELSAHRETLADVEDARKCLQEAQSQVAAEREARAREILEGARKAYEKNRIGRAKELLSSIDPEDLAADELPTFEGLMADIRRQEIVQRLERELDRHLESEDFLGALERARQLVAEIADPEERQHWRRRASELRESIRTVWHLEVQSCEAPLDELRDFRLDALETMPRIWLDDAGRELVLAVAWDDRLFLRVVDVARRLVVSRISLKTPMPLGDSLEVCLDGDRLWIAGLRGGLLELETGSWDVLSWYLLSELLPKGAVLEEVVPLPGGLFLWLKVRLRSDTWQIWVVDLKAWRVARKLPDVSAVLPIVGPEAPRVVISEFAFGARLHTALGTSASTEPLVGRYVYAAAISPDGQGLMVGVQKPRPDDEPTPEQLAGSRVALRG